MGAKLDLLT